jgi:hypothetical protein
MSESKRQYLSEFALGMYTSNWMMFPSSEISAEKEIPLKVQDILDNCHIYLICKSPRISFTKELFLYENGEVTGNVIYKINGKKRLLPFKQKFPLLDGATKVKLSEYPHREIITLNDNDESIRCLPANLLAIGQKMHINNSELSNLEILYIGQAYGEGNISAMDRLKNHSTLQKILAEIHYSSPDDEINILTFQYEPYQIITSMDGKAKAKITDYRDIQRFHSIIKNPLTEYQQICLIEAGLIRYFQPKYNKTYKETFPSEKHKILEECYSLDFSGLIVEINTEELGFLIYSKLIKPSSHHICNIELINPEERWGFFHFFTSDGNMVKMQNVILKKT